MILGLWYLLIGGALTTYSTYCIWGMGGVKMLGYITMLFFGIMCIISGFTFIYTESKRKEKEKNEKSRTKS